MGLICQFIVIKGGLYMVIENNILETQGVKNSKQSCPKCGSIFITSSFCESCGLQFSFDRLGEPFGERSFFCIKEDFEDKFKLRYFLFKLGLSKRDEHIERYKTKLLRRFEVLSCYFFLASDSNREKRRLFVYEAKEIISELGALKMSLSALWKTIEKGEGHPLHNNLAKSINDLQKLKNVSKGPITREFKEIIFELIPEELKLFPSWRALSKFVLGGGALISASYILLKYLLGRT